MKAMSFVMFIFAVAGLAVAAEKQKLNQSSVSPTPDCTCTGLNKSTGKPWTENECQSACSIQKAVGGGLYSGFNPETLVAQANSDGPDQRPNQKPTPGKEITRGQMIAGIVIFVLLTCAVVGLLGWRIMKQGPRKKKRKYRTDQEKAIQANTPLPAAPVTEPRPPAQAQISVIQADQPEPLAHQPAELEEVIDITRRPQEIQRVIGALESWANPEIYRWAYWGTKLSEFTMGRFGFQPEMKLFSGGIEISVQAEHECTWFEVIGYAVQEVFPVSLKLAVLEQDEEGCVMVLMPEESVRFAVLGESNVLTLTEGLRRHLLPAVTEQHRRAIGD